MLKASLTHSTCPRSGATMDLSLHPLALKVLSGPSSNRSSLSLQCNSRDSLTSGLESQLTPQVMETTERHSHWMEERLWCLDGVTPFMLMWLFRWLLCSHWLSPALLACAVLLSATPKSWDMKSMLLQPSKQPTETDYSSWRDKTVVYRYLSILSILKFHNRLN